MAFVKTHREETTRRVQGPDIAARFDARLDFLEEALTAFQAQVEQKHSASRHLLDMNIDSVRRELEAAARAIQQKDHTELLQQAEAVAASSATKAVRESLHEEMVGISRKMTAISDTLDERLRIMEDRLKSMDKRLGKSVEEFYHQVEDLEHRFANDESKLDPTVAALIPKLVQSWGEGRFTSQGDMAKWIDGKFDNLEADLSGDMRGLKVEIQELLKNANKNMSQRMDQLVSECVENKITPVENQLTSMEMMLRNVLARQTALEENPPAARQAEEEVYEDPEETQPEAAPPGDNLGTWLKNQIRAITDQAGQGSEEQELSGPELLAWMRNQVTDMVQDLVPPPNQKHNSLCSSTSDVPSQAGEEVVAAAESAEKLSNLEISTSNLAARLAALEDAALVGRVAALEGACLEERLALLETSRPVFSGGPAAATAGNQTALSPASISQVLSLREEVHRLRNRVGVLEQLVQIPDMQVGPTEPKSPPYAEGSPKLGSPRRFEGDEDIKRSLSDLWCAVSGDQRTLGILSSKMEDAVRDFSRLQTRFEAALPQLLQLLSELLRRHGGGTGETGEGSEMDVLVAMQKLLFGGESGMPFVSPHVLRETFSAFEAVMRSEMERLRDELFRAMADKAKLDDTEFLAEQMRLLHGQLQMLWQNFEKLIAGEKESNAAIWRTPLHARCVSCDKKVDIKGMVLLDRDPAFLPTQSPSPVPHERASSARRARGPRDLPSLSRPDSPQALQ